ncbi:NusG domain II-containing protein [Ruminococcaceae bacterium OttesenSCG-928-N02]|nr:NusG domain II-containing protein [Ruminococcaceae bacterium OttesenSCG-928-N02]
MEQERKLKTRDILIVGAVLLFAVGALLYRHVTAAPGAAAYLYITDPQQTLEISLDEDGVFTFEAALPITLEVQGGAVRFINAQCPDHLCEGFGFIRNAGESATCLPAGAHLEIAQE